MTHLLGNSLSLASTSQLLSSLASVFAFLLSAAVAGIAWRERNALNGTTSESESSTSKDSKDGSLGIWAALESSEAFRRGRVGLNLMSMTVALIAFALLMTGLKADVHDTIHYEYTMVPVLSRDDPYTFTISVPKDVKKPSGPRENLAVTSCQDLMPTDEVQPGVMFKWIAYDEDRVHHCSQLDGHDVGYSLDRRNHVPVIHDLAPYTGSRSTRPEAETATEASTTAATQP